MVKIRSSSLQAQCLQLNTPNSESVTVMDFLCVFHHTSCPQLKIYCGQVYVFMHTVHIAYKTSCVDLSIICI